MNFQTTFREGREGKNVGRTTGISRLDKAIGGIQRKKIITVAAAAKVGKSKLVNSCFVISPYEEAIIKGTLDDIDWIYYSFEMDRISVEFEFVAYYIAKIYAVFNFMYNGKIIQISSEYLRGQKIGDDGEFIRVLDEHTEMVKHIYTNRIVPLFGEFDENGRQISRGKIIFINQSDNPTGLRNYLFNIAKQEGTFLKEQYYTMENDKKVLKERIVGYRANNESHVWIVITDTMRKLKPERGFDKKQTVDKWAEYQVEFRNLRCGFTFIDIIHTNRNMSDTDRMKYSGEFLYPTGDDVKDSGNLSEDSDVVLTMFNPTDKKYGLIKHFGLDIEANPNYRSIHVVESRGTECPLHIQVNMFGAVGMFQAI